MTGIERLRKLSKDLIHYRLWNVLDGGTEEDWDCYQGDVRTVNDELLSIADQIEREHAEDCLRMGERAAEDREAIACVRDHGGLDAVDAIWDNDVPLAEAVISELWPDGRPDECGNDDVMGELRRRLVPEGCEWPRYEDGEPVRIGGAIADGLGCEHVVTSVELHDYGADLHWNPDEPEERVWVDRGEPVRRPAKPEIDSWERIEEDARGLDSGLDRELFTHTHEDIVRRCRALAERERGE